MLSLAAYTLLASGALAAAVERRWEYPESMPLVARQAVPAPGTPLYACHENCGLTITLAREPDYCNIEEFQERFQACMECAYTYNVWIYYGTSVSAAAPACGLTAVPSPSGWEPTPEPTPSPPAAQSSTDESVPSSTEPPVVVPSDVTEPVEPSVPAQVSSTAPPAGGSTEAPVVGVSTTAAASSAAEPSASAEPSGDESVPSAVASAAPSGSDAASAAPYPLSSPVYVAPVGGNNTTLCTSATAAPSGSVPTYGGAAPSGSVPTGGSGSTAGSGPQPTDTFETSGAAKLIGSAGVAVLAMLAAF